MLLKIMFCRNLSVFIYCDFKFCNICSILCDFTQILHKNIEIKFKKRTFSKVPEECFVVMLHNASLADLGKVCKKTVVLKRLVGLLKVLIKRNRIKKKKCLKKLLTLRI